MIKKIIVFFVSLFCCPCCKHWFSGLSDNNHTWTCENCGYEE